MFTGFTTKELAIEKGLLNQAIEDFKYKFNGDQIVGFNFFVNVKSYAKSEMDIKNIDNLNIPTEIVGKLIKCLAPNAVSINIIEEDTFTFKVKYNGTTDYSLGIAFWKGLVNIFHSWLMIKASEELLKVQV